MTLQTFTRKKQEEYNETFKNSQFIEHSKIKSFLATAIREVVEDAFTETEVDEKVHRNFECNGAHNGKGCYEDWCEMETCNSEEAIEFKSFNSALAEKITLEQKYLTN